MKQSNRPELYVLKLSTSGQSPILTPTSHSIRADSPTPHYQAFPTGPPRSKGKPLQDTTCQNHESSSRPRSSSSSHHRHHETPLPKKQLIVLAVIALVEQTALNSITPYLADMVASFPEVKSNQVGFFFGLVASSFALAQFATNFFWGWASDRIGRKPIILFGTLMTAGCFVAFGFSRRLWHAMVVQAIMGLVNGNQGVVSTCLGEITDRSNQSRAFTYLPVVYGIGGITGPIVGGLLVQRSTPGLDQEGYPYLPPNLVSAGLLIVELLVTMFFLEESMEELRDDAPLGRRVENLFVWLWEITGMSRRPHRKARKTHDNAAPLTPGREELTDDEADGGTEILPQRGPGQLHAKDIFNKDVILVLTSFLIFQLTNIAYTALYPIFAQAPQPLGRNLSPEEIGISLAFAAIVTIAFQVGVFGRLRDKLGNKTSFRVGLGGFIVAFLLTPWIGYKDRSAGVDHPSKALLWIELGVILIIKTVATVGGLTSALLLITNSARDHTVLGTLNGLAQTLSAAGRAVGPFLAGGLFSLAAPVPKGEALAFGVFAAVAFAGLLLSFGIGGVNLEAENWDEEDGESGEESEGRHETEQRVSERTPLVSRQSS